MNNKIKILLVDDEADILEFMTYNLEKEGYEIFTATNGLDAIEKAMSIAPNLIILDIMMPQVDGIEVCRHIRKNKKLENTLVAFLTARNADYSQISGFEAGADDYISKPIAPKVLVSRIKALLKRQQTTDSGLAETQQCIKTKSLTIDKERYLVVFQGSEMLLPHKEFELLSLLASKPNKVFTRGEIYNAVWGHDTVVGEKTIDVHIRKIREKFGNDIITTIKRVGYRYSDS